ncbi:MAG: DNA alkylation repair protein [Clostridia bacterium]|nr:DNA alkylation repair protein [Clostridia bacterium]
MNKRGIYEETLTRLKAESEEKFLKFSERIVAGEKRLIGVRTDKIRSIAKEVAAKDLNAYLNECEFKFYEDTLIYGLLIASLPFDEFLKYIDVYLLHADSWAHIDAFVPSLSFIKKDGERFFDYLKRSESGADGFKLRFITVSYLDHFLKKENLGYIFKFCVEKDGNGYYNDMAIAWLVSVAYIKFEEETYEFLLKKNLSKFTHNKAISKICDSLRVKNKEKIKALRLK